MIQNCAQKIARFFCSEEEDCFSRIILKQTETSTHPDPNLYEQEIKEISFDGLTGRISFDEQVL